MRTPISPKVSAVLADIDVNGKEPADLRREAGQLAVDRDLSIFEMSELVDALEALTGDDWRKPLR